MDEGDAPPCFDIKHLKNVYRISSWQKNEYRVFHKQWLKDYFDWNGVVILLQTSTFQRWGGILVWLFVGTTLRCLSVKILWDYKGLSGTIRDSPGFSEIWTFVPRYGRCREGKNKFHMQRLYFISHPYLFRLHAVIFSFCRERPVEMKSHYGCVPSSIPNSSTWVLKSKAMRAKSF